MLKWGSFRLKYYVVYTVGKLDYFLVPKMLRVSQSLGLSVFVCVCFSKPVQR